MVSAASNLIWEEHIARINEEFK